MVPNGSNIKPRHTARGIVVHEGKILLMERWRPDLHYFSIPGGGVESGEKPEEAVIREILEETTIVVEIKQKVLEMRDGDIRHEIYLCDYVSGEPGLPADAPEAQDMTNDNRFKPGWVPVAQLPGLPFTYWQPLQKPLIEGMQHGFSGPVKIVSAAQAR